ncbi:MAG: LLM class flavin-dependent oxidoreductase [Acidimicrobiia bacterium]
MKFGVQHGIGDPQWTPAIISPRAMKRFAATAERVGFDAIAFTDHPAPSNRWVESGGEGVADLFTSLGFCAAVTSTIRPGDAGDRQQRRVGDARRPHRSRCRADAG